MLFPKKERAALLAKTTFESGSVINKGLGKFSKTVVSDKNWFDQIFFKFKKVFVSLIEEKKPHLNFGSSGSKPCINCFKYEIKLSKSLKTAHTIVPLINQTPNRDNKAVSHEILPKIRQSNNTSATGMFKIKTRPLIFKKRKKTFNSFFFVINRVYSIFR